jgi:hypothetical protein
VGDFTVTETDSDFIAQVPVSLSAPIDSPVTVELFTQNGSASAPDDYIASNHSLAFVPGGPLTQTVAITIKGETLDEPDESFRVILNNPTGAAISDGTATVTIINDDATPQLTLLDASTLERDTGQVQLLVTAALSAAPKQAITMTLATSTEGASATSGADFAPIAQTITFQLGGPLTQQVAISINGDTIPEIDESFFLVAQNVAGASISRGTARITILDNDRPDDAAPPQLVARRGVVRYGLARQPTLIVLTFSEALDPTSINDLAAYRIWGAGPDRKLGSFDDIMYGAVAMTHLTDSNQVVLRMRKHLPLGQRYELRIGDHGTVPRDLSGNLLDGDGDGRPGGILVRRFGNDVLAGGTRKAPAIPPVPSSDLALVHESPRDLRRPPKRR